MKKYWFTFVLIAFAALAWADEELVFTTPVTKPSQTRVQIQEIHMHVKANRLDVVFVEPNTGELITCSETGTAARDIMNTLNKANLTTNSLDRRAQVWAQGKGCLPAGAISGAPR